MDKKEFVKAIQACRSRLNQAKILKILVFALCIGAGIGIFFQIVSFLIPFYYANLYTGVALGLAGVTALIAAYIKRSTMEQAALVMDSFGFQERIVTAYEHLNEEGKMVQLQREDALKQLQKYKGRIQIPILPPGKKIAGVCGMLLVLLALIMIPSEMKQRAKELHLVQEEAKEKEDEIKEVAEEIEELTEEALTPEQLAALQEMLESMQASMSEYQQATTPQMLATANEKLDFKYGNMSNQLNTLAEALQSGANVSAATAESMQAMAEKLQGMSQNQVLASNQGQGSQNGQAGNGQNGQGNQSGSGQNNGQNSQSGNGQNNGQNGQGNGSGNGQSNGSGNGQGNGSGNGQGNGSGNGQGNGSGSGTGTASGNGRGEGSSNALHDYVSIPNAIIDSGNLTGTAGNHDNSEFFRTQNGLSWEGTHISHEAVIGSYEQNAYEGIAAGQYPSGMEDVIKEYFASFN